jgi:hypothetical protein
MNVKVTGCKDCPMFFNHLDGWFSCTHPNEDDGEFLLIESKDFVPITPNWCPLNKEPITIEKV